MAEPRKFIAQHRPVPPPIPGSVDGLIDSSVDIEGRKVSFSDPFTGVARIFAKRIERAFWNGDPKFHSGFAFDEIALILAELEARIIALEP